MTLRIVQSPQGELEAFVASDIAMAAAEHRTTAVDKSQDRAPAYDLAHASDTDLAEYIKRCGWPA